ncbi:MAG: hypothetical protein AAFR79_04025 [Pseudomonadota bacterium]
MFKDDRFISILSGVVLMIAIGTVVQRGGPLVEYFGGGSQGPVLVRDRADATPGALTVVDVLANDRELTQRNRAELQITGAPGCGKAFVQDSRVHYVPEDSCVGEQRIGYSVGQTDGANGELIVAIAPPEIDEKVTVPEPAIAAAPQTIAPTGLEDGGPQPEAPAAPAAPSQVAVDTTPALEPDPVVRSTDADPLRARLPGAPQPLGPAQVDTSPLALGTGDADESPVVATTGPTELGPVADEAPALAQAEISAPVARPTVNATRAPGALRTGVTDTRNNDFAAASSRGGLLARPSRASTSAAPAPTVLAQIQEAEQRPTIGDVAPAWRPSELTVTAPSDARVALTTPESGLDTPRRGPAGGLSLEQPQGTDTATDLAAAADEGIEPTRASPAALRFGAAVSDRVSQLSPPPTPDSLAASRFDPQAPQPTASVSLARVDRSVGAFRSPSAPTIGRGPGTLAGPAETSVSRSAVPSTAFSDAGRVALAAPASGLGEVRQLGNALTIVPVDTTSAPSGLAAPTTSDDVSIAALPRGFNPDAQAIAPESDIEGDTAEGEETELAALPSATAKCDIPPALTIDPRGAAFTQVIVKSPCHSGDVITLSYGELDFALQVDGNGVAQLTAPGFEPRSKARLSMPDGESLDFDIPFADTGRIIRVALVWDTAVNLELHALANGRGLGSAGHINPANPSSLRKARRGGGFLTTYFGIDGVGQNLQVYTHVPRRGRPEVVKMLIDFATRRRATSQETCGDGSLAAPAFRVVRSNRGQLERILTRRLSAIDCSAVRTEGARLIEQAVKDVVISSR